MNDDYLPHHRTGVAVVLKVVTRLGEEGMMMMMESNFSVDEGRRWDLMLMMMMMMNFVLHHCLMPDDAILHLRQHPPMTKDCSLDQAAEQVWDFSLMKSNHLKMRPT